MMQILEIRYRGLPIEIEVSGEIRPEGLPAILECLLNRLNRWVENLQEEKRENEGLP